MQEIIIHIRNGVLAEVYSATGMKYTVVDTDKDAGTETYPAQSTILIPDIATAKTDADIDNIISTFLRV